MPTPSAAKELKSLRIALRQLQRTTQETSWALDRLRKFLARLQLQLNDASLDRLAPALAAQRPRKLRITPERRAALKLQGQYMGYMRGLRPRQKAQVKKIRAQKGIRAAIAEAKRLAS